LVDLCIHIANILYLGSFLTRDMLWLRLLTCAGLVLGVVFFTCQPSPMYGPTVWHITFLGINCIQIVRLVRERRRLRLPLEQERVAEEAFGKLSRDQLLTLLTRAMCDRPEKAADIPQACQNPLSEDECVVRDMALSHLSRNEMKNLLARRLWHCLRWLNPIRWGQRQPPAEQAVAHPEPVRRTVG
jgi:hypothetical protein